MRLAFACALFGACSFQASQAAPDGTGSNPGPPGHDAALVDSPAATGDGGSGSSTTGPQARELAVTGAMVSGASHADFPLLVALTEPWLKTQANGGGVASATGADVHFSGDAAGSSPLDFELESYDPAAGTVVAWVRIPALTPTTTFYIDYGDATIATSEQNVAGVWKSGYAAVWHLSDDHDSLGAANGADASTTAQPGQIGGARQLDGSTSEIDLSANAATNNVFATGGTIEVWLNASTWGEGNLGRIFDKTWVAFGVGDGLAAGSIFFAQGFSNSNGNWTAGANMQLAAWTHVVVTYDASSASHLPTVYIDAAPASLSAITSPSFGDTRDDDSGEAAQIGDRASDDRRFDGRLDELRISHVMRDANWIATEYANQLHPDQFVTVVP